MAATADNDRHRTGFSSEDDELEQYGVWVKAGPEDVDESAAEETTFALADLEEPDESEDTPEDLGEPDQGWPEPVDDLSDSFDLDTEEVSIDVPEIDEELEPLEMIDLGEERDDAGQSDPSTDPGAVDEPAESFDLLDLEEAEEPAAEEPAAEEPTRLDHDLVFDDDLPADTEEVAMGTETVEPAPSAQPEDADLTLDLDSLDVDSFAEEPLETAEPVEVEEVTDFDLEALTEEAPSEAPPSQELEDLEFADFDLEALPETGAETEPAPADDEFPEDTSAEIDLDEQMTEITLDDLPPEPAPPPVAPSADDSRALLQRIEHELAAIHAEIGDLKRELAGLRPRPSPAAAATDEEPSSFFAETEDEDETIALTGDELDNIMNTAEFTEEKGRPTEYEDLGGIALEEAGTEAEDLDLDILTATEETDQGMDTFAASEDHVEALASMDIDAELADIAELQDQTDVFAADGTEEPILDAEPLDLELEPEEEQPRQQAPSAPVDRGTPAVPAPVPPRREPDAPGHDPLQSPSPAPREPAAEPRLPDDLKAEMRSVLAYMDQLLEWLPQEKIQEFASSEHWRVYQRLFEELGLDQ